MKYYDSQEEWSVEWNNDIRTMEEKWRAYDEQHEMDMMRLGNELERIRKNYHEICSDVSSIIRDRVYIKDMEKDMLELQDQEIENLAWIDELYVRECELNENRRTA